MERLKLIFVLCASFHIISVCLWFSFVFTCRILVFLLSLVDKHFAYLTHDMNNYIYTRMYFNHISVHWCLVNRTVSQSKGSPWSCQRISLIKQQAIKPNSQHLQLTNANKTKIALKLFVLTCKFI